MASIKFDDGKEVTLSKETTETLRKEVLKPALKHGDIVQGGYGGTLRRIILKYKGELVGFSEVSEFNVGDLDEWAEDFNYVKIGNVFEMNIK